MTVPPHATMEAAGVRAAAAEDGAPAAGGRDAREAAREYIRRGWRVVPLAGRAKRPTHDGWPDLRIAEDDVDTYFPAPSNVGVLLGEPSGWLVDVDLDCEETRTLADAILPATSCTFGRDGAPRSHRLYVARGAATVKYTDPDVAGAGAMLVELRSAGAQTMAPGSVHPTGELVEWASAGDPTEMDAEDLRRHGARLAAAALLVRCYPGAGARHDYVLAVAGVLARALEEADAERMLLAIARAAGDEEAHARRADLRSTLRRLAAERPASGWPTLEGWLGAARTARVREWLGAAAEHWQASDWPEMQPLPAELPPVPAMSSELLPAPFRAWLDDAADRLQVPLEMVATPALVGFASVVGRRLGILPKRQDDWLVVPNLWGMVVARPGYLKSPAMREAVRPISRLAAEAAKQHRADKILQDAEREVLETSIAKLKREAASKNGKPELMRDEIKTLLRKLDEAVAIERRYVTSDPTTEKLGELLNQNPAGLLLLRDELSGWLRNLEKPGREGDREFYIEAWNGTGRYDVDRIGRGTLHIEAVTVSIFGTIQPGKLRRYTAAATSADETSADDGMLQRFQLVAWPDFTGEWTDVDRWPAKGPRDAAYAIFQAASTLDPERFGATSDHSEIPAIRFCADAQELFRDWRGELERRLRSEELASCPAFESHVSKYRKLMPALALVIHVAESFDPNLSVSSVHCVGLSAAKRAAALVDFYEQHACRLYADELGRARPACALAAKIKAGAVRDGDSVRSVRRRDLSGLDTQENVEAALAKLTSLGWLRIEHRHAKTKPERMIRLHPALLEGVHHG
ncbi:MAG: DUF3987 domain-containing protein [Thermodesulfobacteriota bacterium]